MAGEENRPDSPLRSLDQLIDDSNRLRNEVHRLTELSRELSRQIEKLLGEHAHAGAERDERPSNEPNK